MQIHYCAARFGAAVVAALLAAFPVRAANDNAATGLDALAEQYVRLVLAIGEHDPDFVDAYYGPPQWRDDARAHKQSLEALDAKARRLADQLRTARPPDALSELRRRSLGEQLASIRARLEILRGKHLSFDEEARRIYGVAPPHHEDEFYRSIHRQLDAALPGQGPLRDRMDAFKKKFIVPPERVRAALDVALTACRSATLAHTTLPPDENFQLELVKDKPWSAYNWYKGGYQSLIQVNVGLPLYASSMAATMCHEGYPGHHVLNALLEQRLVKARGWIEYTVYPLFSAESLLAEGAANFGLDLVFPGDTQWQWERDHLYPIAGIDPSLAELRHRVTELNKSLAYASIDAARAYLDGTRPGEQTVAWLQEFTFATNDEAKRSLQFFETYRSYVVNYKLGEDLVRQHVDKVAGKDLNARWNAFLQLLASPPIVADLAKGTTLDPSPGLNP
jgi:hypothetical protein